MIDERARWRRRQTALLLDCTPWLKVYADEVQLPDGRRVENFLRVDGREYAVVFAVTEADTVLFLRQYKYGPDAVILDLPAGYRESEETPMACAQRELLEETGYAAPIWRSLGSFVPDGNRGFGRAHLFLAQGARAIQPAASGDLEEMQLEQTPLPQVTGVVRAGDLAGLAATACSALALLYLTGVSAPPRGTETGMGS